MCEKWDKGQKIKHFSELCFFHIPLCCSIWIFLNLGPVKKTDCFDHIYSTASRCPTPITTCRAPFGQGSPSCSQTSSHSHNTLSLLSLQHPRARISINSVFQGRPNPELLFCESWSHQNLSSDLILMFNPGPRIQLGQLSLPLAGPFTAAIAKLPSESPPTVWHVPWS